MKEMYLSYLEKKKNTAGMKQSLLFLKLLKNLILSSTKFFSLFLKMVR